MEPGRLGWHEDQAQRSGSPLWVCPHQSNYKLTQAGIRAPHLGAVDHPLAVVQLSAGANASAEVRSRPWFSKRKGSQPAVPGCNLGQIFTFQVRAAKLGERGTAESVVRGDR